MAPRPGIDRRKVLEAAIAVAQREGPNHLTWSLVARELGIKPPSLYNHVDSLDHLRGLLALEGVRGLLGVLRAETTLEAMARAYVRYGRENPVLYHAALRAPGPRATELAGLAGQLVQHVVHSLEPLGIPPHLHIHAVRVFRSVLHGFVSIEASGGFGLPDSLDTTLDVLLATLVAGLENLGSKEDQT